MDGFSAFMGSDALARGLLRPHQLRSRFRAVLPDVYVPRDNQLSIQQRAHAAWLWSHQQGVIAGLTAAALLGSRWVDEHLPIELFCSNSRSPRGVQTARVQLPRDEFSVLAGLPVTTPHRTAFDLGRRKPIETAVAHLDALLRATDIKIDDVAEMADRHRGARGLRQLETALDLVDVGAQSPRETSLRLLLIRAGLPRPTTQIPVLAGDGTQHYYLDMGWKELMIAVEYDGEQHRLDRSQYSRDIRRSEALERLGWIVIRVLVTDRPAEIIRRVRQAIEFRASTVQ